MRAAAKMIWKDANGWRAYQKLPPGRQRQTRWFYFFTSGKGSGVDK